MWKLERALLTVSDDGEMMLTLVEAKEAHGVAARHPPK